MTTYKEAGVDIESTDALVEDISSLSQTTARSGIYEGIGGFGGIFDLKKCGYDDPLLVSGTDGIGTKILLGIETDILDGLGHDLVGMCLNDVLCHGAEPLFFLDYYASSKIDKKSFLRIMKSITEACKINNCMLLGGETAEMPGLYKENDFDFAGFCVGAVERKKILPKKNVMKEGDLLFGIKSSGFHSNGYSLIRKVLRDTKVELNSSTDFNSNFKTNATALMAPTRLYYPYLKKLLETDLLNGISHITGGGITGNVPRMLPEELSANINKDLFFKDDIFEWFKNLLNISNDEMYKTFNCGLGLVVSVAKENYDQFIDVIQNENLEIFEVGLVEAANSVRCKIS
ncbi:phosphoribosylformylglycinamidine cyclo-ligase [Pelagibacteraceae bacterium]|nr:phosphoribosylformylglycinamidine cyclo-ligase [Pelagibacteraceae bacterium]